jgi:hypothetical protein
MSTNKGRKSFTKKGKTYKPRKGKSGGGGSALVTGKTKSASPSVQIEPWMPIFPVVVTKKLRYSTTFQLVCTAGAAATYVFRANDLFDPDYTGTGHQPMGFDQMILFYNHFVVTKAKIKATVRNKSNTSPFTACLRVDSNVTPITVVDRVLEFGGLTTAEVDTFGSQCVLLELGVDIPRFQGLNHKSALADGQLRGDAGSSPSELVLFHVQVWDTAALTSTANIDVIMEQTAVFMEPRDLTESFAASQVRDLEPEEKKTNPLKVGLPRRAVR